MIFSFKCKHTKEFWETGRSKKLPSDLHRVALRKLVQLHNARLLDDLRVPPKNMLKALNSNRIGQYSIRINDQFRICFIWEDDQVHDVEIIDYH